MYLSRMEIVLSVEPISIHTISISLNVCESKLSKQSHIYRSALYIGTTTDTLISEPGRTVFGGKTFKYKSNKTLSSKLAHCNKSQISSCGNSLCNRCTAYHIEAMFFFTLSSSTSAISIFFNERSILIRHKKYPRKFFTDSTCVIVESSLARLP